MKVAIITPYHDLNNPYFLQCIESVQQQTYRNFFHVLVGDGCHYASLDQYQNIHSISLPQTANNYGDTPRSVGVIYAFSVGAEAVMFLDSDNWYAENHLESMVAQCMAFGSDVVTCRRYLTHLNGSVMGTCPNSDGEIFCDTNCFMVTRALAEEAGAWWLIPDDLHVIDDRVMWDTLIHSTDKISSTSTQSVFYRTAFEFHYTMFGLKPPLGAKVGEKIAALGDIIDSLQARAQGLAIQRKCGKK